MPSTEPKSNHQLDLLSPLKSLNGHIAGSLRDYLWYISLFSRNVRLFLIGSFLIGLTFATAQLLMNLYLKERGGAESFIGTFLSAGAFGTAIIAIPAAIALRKIRLKFVLIGSTIIYMAIITAISRLGISNWLIFLSFLLGVTATFNRIAAAPFFMRNSTPEERTYVFSFNFGVLLLAGMVGSVVSGWLVAWFTTLLADVIQAYQWTFVISIICGIAAVIPFALIKAAAPTEEDRQSDFSWSLLRRQSRLYLKLLLPQFLVGIGAGLIIPFLNLYFRDRFRQSPDQIGLLFFAVNTAMLLGILAGPVLAKKIGMVKTIVATELLSIPFMIILAFSYSLPLAVVAFLVRGALMNMAQPIGTNFSMEMVGRMEHALVNALLTLSWTGSLMISTVIGGELIEKHGYTLPLMIAVALYIASAILYYLFFRGSERKAGKDYLVEVT